jgi:hypothetical protein
METPDATSLGAVSTLPSLGRIHRHRHRPGPSIRLQLRLRARTLFRQAPPRKVNIVAPGILFIPAGYIELIVGDINDQFRRQNMTKSRRRTTTSPDPNALVLHETVLALSPEVLHTQAERSVRALLKEGESANTVRSYASALRYWSAWFRLRYRTALALPLPVPVVLQFLVDHVQRTDPDHGSLVRDLPPAIDAALTSDGSCPTSQIALSFTRLDSASALSRRSL